MQRDYRVYLDDIVEAVARIREYAPEISALEDRKTVDGVSARSTPLRSPLSRKPLGRQKALGVLVCAH